MATVGIYKYDSNRVQIRHGYYGRPLLSDYSNLFRLVFQEVSGSQTMEEVVSKLRSSKKDVPEFKEIADRLENITKWKPASLEKSTFIAAFLKVAEMVIFPYKVTTIDRVENKNTVTQITTTLFDKFLNVWSQGMLTVYNAAGEILTQEAFPEPDMRDFIDTMKVYVLKINRNTPDKQNNPKSGTKYFKQYCTAGNNICELPNGNVMIESPVTNEKNTSGVYPGISGTLKSRIELNPEMTKTLQHDIFQGNNLIQRKKYTYNSSKNLMSLHHNRVICENPQSIETFTLTMNSEGYPVIRHSKEFYKTNQTRYYFK